MTFRKKTLKEKMEFMKRSLLFSSPEQVFNPLRELFHTFRCDSRGQVGNYEVKK